MPIAFATKSSTRIRRCGFVGASTGPTSKPLQNSSTIAIANFAIGDDLRKFAIPLRFCKCTERDRNDCPARSRIVILTFMRIAVSLPKKPAYRPLKTAFRSKGFDYRQIERKGDVALFAQTKPGLLHTWYEVVVVQRHDEYEIGGAKVEAAETMPSTSQWGRLGWTYRDEKSAKVRFDELVKNASSKTKGMVS